MATVLANPIPPSTPPATIDDLHRVEGKAELINGRIVRYMATGDLPGAVALQIVVRLLMYAQQTGVGIARGDNVGYALPRQLRSGRQTFSPDASYYVGPLPANRMKFIEGAPTFAVEVRSEGDYTPAAQREIAAKRADYFEAGTLAVWDVDPVAQTVTLYPSAAPTQPIVFRAGDIAHAEFAVPGWTVAVSEIFAV
jgi:Uma2 family endonuclease